MEVFSPVIETGTLSDCNIQLNCERHVITTTPRKRSGKPRLRCVRNLAQFRDNLTVLCIYVSVFTGCNMQLLHVHVQLGRDTGICQEDQHQPSTGSSAVHDSLNWQEGVPGEFEALPEMLMRFLICDYCYSSTWILRSWFRKHKMDISSSSRPISVIVILKKSCRGQQDR